MAKKLALGKGIASLLQDTPQTVVSETLKSQFEEKKSNQEFMSDGSPLLVDISKIIVNKNQPRKIFKEKDLEDLTNSIRENGILQPLMVSLVDGGYELIAGERRLRASISLGIDRVPVIVKRATDKDKMLMSIIENVQRADLNCVEEALAYYQLMDDFKLSQEDVAKKVGKERSTVANFLRILKLPREVIELLQKEIISFGHAKILASIKEGEFAIRFANEAAVKQLSVRELEKLIKKAKNKPKDQKRNPFFNEKIDSFKNKLEQKTGFHFDITAKDNGTGKIVIKFSNEAEFNDIYEYLSN